MKNNSQKWKQLKLRDCLTIKHGKSQKGIEVFNGRYPILATGGIIGRTNIALYDKPSVLIGRKGTINKPQYMETPFWTVDTLFFSQVKNNSLAKYLYYKFLTINWKKYNEGSGLPSLSASTISSINLSLPPLPEQKRIVKVLETWDETIEKLNRKIEIKKKIKRGLMQKLLTGAVRLPGFVEEWMNVRLDSIGNTYSGIIGKNSDSFGKGKPFISYMNVYTNPKINICINSFVDIGDNEKQNKVQFGDLFFTTSSETPNEVGISSVLLDKDIESIYLNSFCFGFRLNNFKTIAPVFAQFYFRGQDFRKQMTRIAQGASRYNLSKKYFLDTKINIPKDIKEQNAIADVLIVADNEIEVLEKQLSLLKDQKKYLLNNLITGKIRTPENLSIVNK